jgi:hypothetical protein
MHNPYATWSPRAIADVKGGPGRPPFFASAGFGRLVLLDRFRRSPSLFVPQLQPLVPPQVLHFRQVPFLTRVKLPHSPQGSPS